MSRFCHTLLRHHERRRQDGLPTLSVLVGPPASAIDCWHYWAAEAGYGQTACPISASDSLASNFIDYARANCDLPRVALNELLERAGQAFTSSTSPLSPLLDGRTKLDIDALAEAASIEPDAHGVAVIAREICRLAIEGRLESTELLNRIGSRGTDEGDVSDLPLLRALDQFVPHGACPAFLLTCAGSDGGESTNVAARFDRSVRRISQFVQAVPRLPMAITLTEPEFESYERSSVDSQAKSLVITGRIDLGLYSRHDSIDGELVAPDQFVPSISEEAQTSDTICAGDEDDARSHAERLLFRMLEQHPKTRRQFVPNGSPGFKFGPRPAEVDLLASKLRLAIEIDGYFHFTHPDSYRRDRRKDWQLQRHGYTVVRLLAEDIPARMQEVLDFVVSVVEHCRLAASEHRRDRGSDV